MRSELHTSQRCALLTIVLAAVCLFLNLPFAVFGSLAAIGCGAVVWHKETRSRHTPQPVTFTPKRIGQPFKLKFAHRSLRAGQLGYVVELGDDHARCVFYDVGDDLPETYSMMGLVRQGDEIIAPVAPTLAVEALRTVVMRIPYKLMMPAPGYDDDAMLKTPLIADARYVLLADGQPVAAKMESRADYAVCSPNAEYMRIMFQKVRDAQNGSVTYEVYDTERRQIVRR